MPQYPSSNDKDFDLYKKMVNNLAELASGEAGDVASVNGKTGVVILTESDIDPSPTSAVAASNIDWSLSKTYSKTLSANTTFTFSNDTDGQTIVVAITNTAGNYTVAWPAAVQWSGGTEPVQTIGAFTDVITFVKIGSTIYGSSVQNFS